MFAYRIYAGMAEELIPEDVVIFEFEYLHDFEPAIDRLSGKNQGTRWGCLKKKF